MNRSVILRFSDAETSTIAAHKDIVATNGATWWGWWKKQTEHFPRDVLRYLKSEAPLRPVAIGLLKRKEEEEFFLASCIGISFNENGSPISSPDPDLTPSYYRASPFPAWFKFDKIDVIDKRAFLRQFGFVPASDPTFYEVFQDRDGTISINPKPTWSMKIVNTPGDAILHLSDLHFGADHGFPLWTASPGTAVERPTLVEIISSRVFRDLGTRVGVVVVSGDLITRGASDAYSYARTFLEDLLSAFDLEPQHCVIVPGNHDLWTVGLEHPTRDYGHERPYRMFADAFFGTKLQDLERVRRYRTVSGVELIFIELNSARLRSDGLREYGYVSKHRYSDLLRFVNNVLDQDTTGSAVRLKFAVLHHHLIPVGSVSVPEDKKPVSLCLDAGELISEFQANGVRFVLHGHEHAPFLGTVGRLAGLPSYENCRYDRTGNQLFILGCGSSGANRERLPPELGRNVFGVYRPVDRSLEVRFEQYTHDGICTPLWQNSLPIS